MKLAKITTRLLLSLSLVFSFTIILTAPVTSYANQSSSKTQQKKAAKTTTKTVTSTASIPFPTQHQTDSSLAKGQTTTLQAGHNGKESYVYRVTYNSKGKQTKKVLVSKKLLVAAVPKIIGVGSYVAPAPAPTPAPTPAPAPAPAPTTTSYTNVDGNQIESPDSSPAGATGVCNDGSYTHAVHHQGACSSHGGVSRWL